MKKYFITIGLLLLTIISFAQELSRDIVLKHSIKKVTISNNVNNSVVEYFYNEAGLLTKQTEFPTQFYDSLCSEVIEYNYKDTFLVSKIESVKAKDSLSDSCKITYDYDEFGRLENEFYSQSGFSSNESLTHFKYFNNDAHPYNWQRLYYWTDTNFHGKKPVDFKFKNGKTYYLRDYKYETGTDFKNPTTVSWFSKCDLEDGDSLQAFCNYSNQNEILFGDSIKQIIDIRTFQDVKLNKDHFDKFTEISKVPPTILRCAVLRFANEKIIAVETHDFGQFPFESSTSFEYNSQGLVESSKLSLKYTSYSNPPTTAVYSYKYQFY